jgi:GNAT superfamily N-acetyltransferase
MSKIDIRATRPDDFVDIARIWVQGWLAPLKGHDRAPPENLFETLRARIPRELEAGWELSVAVLDGRVVGMMALFVAEPRLDQLFVEEELRSHGIGKRLLDHAKTRMPGGFWLRTHSLNTKAQYFYAREGMRHLRDEPHPRHPEELFSVFEWRPNSHI